MCVCVDNIYIYIYMDTTAAWKKMRFILLDKSDQQMTDSLSTDVQASVSHVLMSFSVDEILVPRYVNLTTCFREILF